jgi:ParB family chromosome partitioning protein
MARKADSRKGLGRGLSALLGDMEEAGAAQGGSGAQGGGPRSTCPIDRIRPNPAQPRRDFPEEELADLARSIAEHGVLQPVILRPDPEEEGFFQIVAGERRWRAAQRAQLHEIPVILRDLDDRAMLELAIIENVQRSDLSPLEEAAGYARLIETFGYTQDALARVIGKSRSHLANMLRLLGLPDEVQTLLREGQLSAGHARALLGAEDPVALGREAARRGMTVRQVEQAARKAAGGTSGPREGGGEEKDADTKLLEGDLSASIGMRVEIRHGADGAGQVRISYRSLEDLDRLCQRLAE